MRPSTVVNSLHSYILASLPTSVVDANEKLFFIFVFLFLIFLPLTLLLPFYLSSYGTDVVALGYIGTILPVFFTMVLAHVVFSKTWRRMSSTEHFKAGLFAFENTEDKSLNVNWSEKADRAWEKIEKAFREARKREIVLGLKTDSDRFQLIRDSVSAAFENEQVVDLPKKLEKALLDRPKTHYEAKILGILFPQVAEVRKSENRKNIVLGICCFRLWVWKSTICWTLACLIFFCVPLGIVLGFSFAKLDTFAPTHFPTTSPTLPTFAPSKSPTFSNPTSSPRSASPSKQPSFKPTLLPTILPTILPTSMVPSFSPSQNASTSFSPSPNNSSSPVTLRRVLANETGNATLSPTLSNISLGPSVSPTWNATLVPITPNVTISPTLLPTFTPTKSPTIRPPPIPLGVISYYLLFIVGYGFPAIYLFCLILEFSFGIMSYCTQLSCIARCRFLCCRRRTDLNAGTPNINDQDNNNNSTRSIFRKKKVRDIKKQNIEQANIDLKEAFEALNAWWRPKKSKNKIQPQSSNYKKPMKKKDVYDESPYPCDLFESLENFQASDLNPDMDLCLVRARALAGLLLFKIQKNLQKGTENPLNIAEKILPYKNRLIELTEANNIPHNKDIEKALQYAKIVEEVEHETKDYFPMPPAEYLDKFLNENLIPQLEYIDRGELREESFLTFQKGLYLGRYMACFEKKQDENEKYRRIEILSHIGIVYFNLYANKKSPPKSKMVTLLQDLKEIIEDQKIIFDDIYVKRCFFWNSFYSRQHEYLEKWKLLNECSDKQELHNLLEKFANIREGLRSDINDLVTSYKDAKRRQSQNTPPPDKFYFDSETGLRITLERENSELIQPGEEQQIEILMCQAEAAELLARTKLGIGSRSNKPAFLSEERTKVLEKKYVYGAVNHDVRFAFGIYNFQEIQSKVDEQWNLLNSNGNEEEDGKSISIREKFEVIEDSFRKGYSFQLVKEEEYETLSQESRLLFQSQARRLEKLRAKSCSGMVLLGITEENPKKAEEWISKLQTDLKCESFDLPYVQQAIEKYREYCLLKTFGRHWLLGFYRFAMRNNGKMLLHLFLFWFFFVIPLILILNYMYNHEFIKLYPTRNLVSYYFWLIALIRKYITAILAAAYFAFFLCFRMTLEKRTIWFGEREAFEEMDQTVSNTLTAAEYKINPKFGGEYPIWAMGEYLVTPGKRLIKRTGYSIRIVRFGVFVIIFGVIPIIALPPLVSLYPWSELSICYAQYCAPKDAILIMAITLPILTAIVFGTKLGKDALPRTARHASKTVFAWCILMFIFPITLGTILLAVHLSDYEVYTPNGDLVPVRNLPPQDNVAVVSLYIWIISGTGLGLFIILNELNKNWNDLLKWITCLRLEQKPVEDISWVWLKVSLFVGYTCPLVCWILIMVALSGYLEGLTSQNFELSITALEAASCLAVVAGCTAAFKLGIIPQEMSASSHFPLLYLLLGGFIASVCVANYVRQSKNTNNSLAFGSGWEGLAWATSFQIIFSLIYLWECFKFDLERKRFGYFPDDWEKFDPTARFVVESARDVPFLSNDELKIALLSRNIPLPKAYGFLNRKRAETLLEQSLEKEKEEAALFQQNVIKRRKEIKERYRPDKLAEVIFNEIMKDSGNQVVARQFRVKKIRTASLKTILTSLVTLKRRFTPRHLVDILDTEIRVVNILFGVIHPYSFDSVQEFRFVTTDKAIKYFSNCSTTPEILCSLVEIQFRNALVGSRLLVFSNPSERNEFMEFICARTAKKDALHWIVDEEEFVDKIKFVSEEIKENV